MALKLKDLYERFGYVSAAGAVILGIIILFLVAILILAIIIIVQTDDLEEVRSKSKCTDYNPCTKDEKKDGKCVDKPPRQPNGHNCSDWVCLADDAEGECQYNPFLKESECIGDCAGSCLVSSSECPEVEFISDAPDPTLNCTNSMCIWTLDFSDDFFDFPIPCSVDNGLDGNCCQKWLNTSSGNAYSDNYCLTAIPNCVSTNSSDPDAQNYLSQCQFYFTCSCKESPVLILKRSENMITNVEEGEQPAESAFSSKTREMLYKQRHHQLP